MASVAYTILVSRSWISPLKAYAFRKPDNMLLNIIYKVSSVVVGTLKILKCRVNL